MPVLVVGAPLRYRHRSTTPPSSCTAGACSEWRRSRTCPPTASSTNGARSRRATTSARPSGSATPVRALRPRPALRRRRRAGFVLHVEVCEDMWVPVPPSAEAALAGATVLANLSGSPITVGRADMRHLLCRSASSRCLAAYLYAAAGEGESTTDLAWDGQTMIYENGVLLAETDRFPKGARRSVADVDLGLLQAERVRMGTFDDNRRHHADRTEAFRRVGVPPRPARRRPRAAPPGRAVPVRARRRGAAGAGLLRVVQHPGRRPGAATARHRAAQGRHRGVRRARLHPRPDRRGQGDGPGGQAAQRHPRVHAAGVRDGRAHQGQRDPARRGAGHHLRRARHHADGRG